MSNEFVARKGIKSLGGIIFPLVSVTSTYTVLSTDYFIECTSGTFTVTLPTAVGIGGKLYVIKNTGSGTITVATTSSQTIDGLSTISLIQDESIEISSDGSNWTIIGGVGGNILGTQLVSGTVSYTSFTGTPYNMTVSLSTPFANANYSVSVLGGDARSWTIESKTTSGFKINSNSNTPLTSSVYWIANSNS
jgi:hypothetical protein